MTIGEIVKIINGKYVYGEHLSDSQVQRAVASDLMSDVLAFSRDQSVLITGLANAQSVRTAEMLDISCIVLVRNKAPSLEMSTLAEKSEIAIVTTSYSLFSTCGLLFENGLIGGDNVRAKTQLSL